jgi:predicted metal-dependent phosphotriesterase family hydrolase
VEKKVRTLTGDVAPQSLGRTLIHEHLCVDWGEMLGRPKVLDFDYDQMVGRMLAKMEDLHRAGVGAFDDYTYIPRVFLPRLQAEAGVTDEQIGIILEQNPQRVLSFRS